MCPNARGVSLLKSAGIILHSVHFHFNILSSFEIITKTLSVALEVSLNIFLNIFNFIILDSTHQLKGD